jgi:hypothetical protein
MKPRNARSRNMNTLALRLGLSFALITLCQSATAAKKPAEVANEHLLAYYPCEPVAEEASVDASGSAVKSIYSGKVPSLVRSPLGKALYSKGLGDEDIYRYGLDLGVDDFSISFWVLPKRYNDNFGADGSRGLVVYGYNPRLAIYLGDEGGMSLEMPGAGDAAIRTEVQPASGAWTHLAFVVDRNNDAGCGIYVNGEAQPLSSVAMEQSATTPYTMRQGFMLGRSLIGNIDEIRIHRKALTEDETKSLFAMNSEAFTAAPAGEEAITVGEWRYWVDEESGDDFRAVGATMIVGRNLDSYHGKVWTGIPPLKGPIRVHDLGANTSVRCVNPEGTMWAGDTGGEAAVWQGTLGSAVATKLGLGLVFAISGKQLGGQSQYRHAMLWNDATEEGFVDVSVRRARLSAIRGTIGSSQVGLTTVGRQGARNYGVIWHGSAAYGYFASLEGVGPHNGVAFTCTEGSGNDAAIGGYVETKSGTHAVLGNGNVDQVPTGPSPRGKDVSSYRGITWINMNPASAQASMINSISGGRQVGHASLDGAKHAVLWNGTADSVVDLHSILLQSGDDWKTSTAESIHSAGGRVWIIGNGTDSPGAKKNFFLYGQNVIPAPARVPKKAAQPFAAAPPLEPRRPRIKLPHTSALICYYPLDDAVGRRAPDATGNTRDAVYRGAFPGDAAGTLTGILKPDVKSQYSDLFPSLVPGLFGKALRCYGGGYQDVLKRGGLNFGRDDFTFSFWVRPNEFNTAIDFGDGAGRGCVASGDLSREPGTRLAILLDDAGKITLSLPGGSISSTRRPMKNHWTHVAIVVDRNDDAASRIYVNGVSDTLSHVDVTPVANVALDLDGGFRIGQSLIGDIDDFAIYKRTLSESDIKAIFAMASGKRLVPPQPELPAKYRGELIKDVHRPYRIIYNMDSSGHLYGYEQIPEKTFPEYLRSTADFLEGTHVDMLSWCDGSGGNVCSWDSDVMELTGARIGTVDPFLLELIMDGNDPARIVIPAVRKMGVDIFYSFRINDLHDSLPNHPELLATFKIENPEWTIGPGHRYGGKHALDFSHEGVRDFKFNVIKEVFDKYDYDGLEIDFMRSPPYFLPGDEPKKAHILTGLLRRVRDHLRIRGEERGRPIPLLVRVGENLKTCDLDGFDVAAWIKEGLVDMIALGSGAKDIEIEEFKELAQGTDVLVYAGPYSFKPENVYLGLSTSYLHQGADGLYLFNWNAHGSHVFKARAFQQQLLSVISNPEAMRGRNKIFAADTGRPLWTYPHNWMHVVLPLEITPGKPGDVTIMVGEDFSKNPSQKSVELAIRIAGSTGVGVKLNGVPVPDLQQGQGGISAQLRPDQLKLGRNRFTFLVDEDRMTIRAAEIRVLYE